MSSKDATQKMQFLGAIKKWPAWTFHAKTQKWRENTADSAATEAKYVRIPMFLHIPRALE